jgi:hypothetical protein
LLRDISVCALDHIPPHPCAFTIDTNQHAFKALLSPKLVPGCIQVHRRLLDTGASFPGVLPNVTAAAGVSSDYVGNSTHAGFATSPSPEVYPNNKSDAVFPDTVSDGAFPAEDAEDFKYIVTASSASLSQIITSSRVISIWCAIAAALVQLML